MRCNGHEQDSRKSQRSEILGEEEERSAHASIAALRRCERAADSSDEGALAKNATFARAISVLNELRNVFGLP